jgi:hypothetical protein
MESRFIVIFRIRRPLRKGLLLIRLKPFLLDSLKLLQVRNSYFHFLLYLLLISCQQDENITIGEDFLQDDSYAILIDTVSIRTSTIMLDSTKSSGGGVMMVGRMVDREFGRINVSSSFQIGPPDMTGYTGLHESATFDSMVMELIFNGYYYGDTMPNQTLAVYALDEELSARDDGNLYNSTAFAIRSECLGSLSFHPRPAAGSLLSVRLSDALGLDIFQLIKEDNEILADQEAFLERYKGFMITPGEDGEGSCIVGFIAEEEFLSSDDMTEAEAISEKSEETRPLLRLYYHDNRPASEATDIVFELVNEELQYNQTRIDRSGTLLDTILAGDKRLSSRYTDDLTFIQGGQAIMCCIEFPYIENLRLLGNNGMLIYSNLRIHPLKGSYHDPYRLPGYLLVWICNKKNELLEPLYGYLGDTVRSTLYIDKEFDENTYYEIPITPFLQSELNNDLITDYSLILTLPDNQLSYSLERLVIGGNGHSKQAMELALYYLFY